MILWSIRFQERRWWASWEGSCDVDATAHRCGCRVRGGLFHHPFVWWPWYSLGCGDDPIAVMVMGAILWNRNEMCLQLEDGPRFGESVSHHDVEWLLFDVVGAPTVDAQVVEMYNEGEWGGNKRRSSQ